MNEWAGWAGWQAEAGSTVSAIRRAKRRNESNECGCIVHKPACVCMCDETDKTKREATQKGNSYKRDINNTKAKTNKKT